MIRPDDPRLTAYVMDELSVDERADFERELESDPEAQAHLADIRETSALLFSELGGEDATGSMRPSQREALERQADQPATAPVIQLPRSNRWAWGLAAMLAAGVTVTAVVAITADEPTPEPDRLSDRSELADREMREEVRAVPGELSESVAAEPALQAKVATPVGAEADPVRPPSSAAAAVEAETTPARTQPVAAQPTPQATDTSAAAPSQDPFEPANTVKEESPGHPARELRVAKKQGPTAERGLMGIDKGDGGAVGGPVGRLGVIRGARDANDADNQRGYWGHGGAPQPVGVDSVGSENYQPVGDNPWKTVASEPLSTFSADVDTASYSNVRRFLERGTLPPTAAVRVEEMINYFDYHYAQPTDRHPLAMELEVADSPFSSNARLVRIGVQGRTIDADDRPPVNLVFLIDVSGSMRAANKLPLVQKSLTELAMRLKPSDRVAIVTYASGTRLALPSTAGSNRGQIISGINTLRARGATNGGAGIQTAYQAARQHFIKNGQNRVILCTDGDFNVGVTNDHQLQTLIERQRESGVFLSVLGFGMGNLKDGRLERLADKGNGHYAYIDDFSEAQRVLVDDMMGTLFVIAKDVKFQVEFNPAKVHSYRLVGYENRKLAARDFADDRKDAGEVGAGHTVTALYEILAAGMVPQANLKYQPTKATVADSTTDELLTAKIRYKLPDGERSQLIERVLKDGGEALSDATPGFRLAVAAAGFGLKIKRSPHAAGMPWTTIRNLALSAATASPDPQRAELVRLINSAELLIGR